MLLSGDAFSVMKLQLGSTAILSTKLKLFVAYPGVVGPPDTPSANSLLVPLNRGTKTDRFIRLYTPPQVRLAHLRLCKCALLRGHFGWLNPLMFVEIY